MGTRNRRPTNAESYSNGRGIPHHFDTLTARYFPCLFGTDIAKLASDERRFITCNNSGEVTS